MQDVLIPSSRKAVSQWKKKIQTQEGDSRVDSKRGERTKVLLDSCIMNQERKMGKPKRKEGCGAARGKGGEHAVSNLRRAVSIENSDKGQKKKQKCEDISEVNDS